MPSRRMWHRGVPGTADATCGAISSASIPAGTANGGAHGAEPGFASSIPAMRPVRHGGGGGGGGPGYISRHVVAAPPPRPDTCPWKITAGPPSTAPGRASPGPAAPGPTAGNGTGRPRSAPAPGAQQMRERRASRPRRQRHPAAFPPLRCPLPGAPSPVPGRAGQPVEVLALTVPMPPPPGPSRGSQRVPGGSAPPGPPAVAVSARPGAVPPPPPVLPS